MAFHRLAEFVGVDIAAENFQAGGLILFEQRRAGKADKHRVGHHGLHRPVQLAALGAVAFIHKHENLAHRLAGLGFQFLDELFEVVHVPSCRTYGPASRAGAAWPGRVGSSGRGRCWCGHGIARSYENALDLFIQFIAVGDDRDTGVRIVLQNPFGQQHHDDALAAALGVPDDAALHLRAHAPAPP